MTHPFTPQEQSADLRVRAASRLTGSRGTRGAAVDAANALAVLHELASSPDTATDALALLHELQVHQVELDLQAEELRESRAELESALQRQVERFDNLPVGCFTVDARLLVHEVNLQGARMLGLSHDEAHGLPLDSLLSPDSARALRAMVSGLLPGQPGRALALQLQPRDAAPLVVQARLNADPAGAGRCLLVLCAPGAEPA